VDDIEPWYEPGLDLTPPRSGGDWSEFEAVAADLEREAESAARVWKAWKELRLMGSGPSLAAIHETALSEMSSSGDHTLDLQRLEKRTRELLGDALVREGVELAARMPPMQLSIEESLDEWQQLGELGANVVSTSPWTAHRLALEDCRAGGSNPEDDRTYYERLHAHLLSSL
jgi:hypothetical protein